MELFNFVQSITGKVFEQDQFKVYALQRSEILDDETCNYCLSIDGRTVRPDDPIITYGQFHHQCRGIWVEIGIEETDKPEITGIPKYLRDKVGSLSRQNLPKAMPLSGSLAEEFINERR